VLKRLRGKLTYANVMVTLLAFVILCGGAAVAAGELGRNTVGTKQLKKGAVTSAKVKDRSLRPQDFARVFRTPIGRKPGLPGPTGPRGPEGPPGTSTGYQASGSAGPLSSSLFGTQVVNLSVPPGSYFATATVEANTSDGNNGGVNCRLINAGSGASFGTIRFQSIRYPDAENMTLAAGLNVAAGQTIGLQCNREGPSAAVNVVQANIVAVRISELAG
jgi:hypothetical protein